MKYLIFGNGFMGNKFKEFLGDVSHLSLVRVESKDSIRSEVLKFKPEVVINCIGKTGVPNVDWCEDHKAETLFANVTVPAMFASVCAEIDQYWVHIGSGCVYEGDNNGKGFSEEDTPNFRGSFYSRTKIYSEQILSEFNNILQLRLRIPIDDKPLKKNLIYKLLHYPKIISVKNSMSVVSDFVRVAKDLADKKKTGIYNLTNPGSITHSEVMDMYRDIVDPSFKYELFSLEELGKITKAKRSNCILDTSKLEKEGIFISNIYDVVRNVLVNYKNNLK